MMTTGRTKSLIKNLEFRLFLLLLLFLWLRLRFLYCFFAPLDCSLLSLPVLGSSDTKLPHLSQINNRGILSSSQAC